MHNPTVTIVATQPIRHNLKRYEKGDELQVKEARAAQLIADGAAKLKAAAKAEESAPAKKTA